MRKIIEYINTWSKYKITFGLSKRPIFILVILAFISSLFEVIGISMFLPIFEFIKENGDVAVLLSKSGVWLYIVNLFETLDMNVNLGALLIFSLSLFVTKQLFTYLKQNYHSKIQFNLEKIIRDKLFNNYLYANTSFHDSLPIGNMTSLAVKESHLAIIGVMTPIDLIVAILTLLIYASALILLSWEATIAATITLLIASQIPRGWIKMSEKIGKITVVAEIGMTSFLIERLRSPRLVRLSRTEKAEISEYNYFTEKLRSNNYIAGVLENKTQAFIEPIVIGICLFFIYVSYIYLNIRVEIIGLFLIISLRLLPVVRNILTVIQKIRRNLGVMEIIDTRLNEMKNNVEVDDGQITASFFDKIEFKGVSYTYPGSDNFVLSDINFTIGKSEFIGLVGASGGGKSTLIDLLPRLRLPNSGQIFIDGNPLDDFILSSLRGLISYVPQDPQVFNGTIENHIRYGKPNATKSEIQDAAKLAGAHNFIKTMTKGYQTNIGENAIKLSGGQRQRLDLTRALVSKAPILILDEPTSNLDPESESKFLHSLECIMEDRDTTIILISHRLGCISSADRIIILSNGCLEAIGKHHELLEKSIWYSRAWASQQEESIDQIKTSVS